MTIRQQALDFIEDHEGVVLRAYPDPVGILTVGIGHTSAAGPPRVVPGMTITRAEALSIFARDIVRYEARVRAELPGAPEHVIEGGTSFDFNTGAIVKASWPDSYKVGKMAAAETTLKQWNKASGRVLPGLTRRRNEEADIIFRARYPDERPGANASISTTGGAVALYQQQLADLGYYKGPVDGLRGSGTVAAVERFQKDHDMTVDGIVGPATRATLIRALGAKRAKENAGAGAGAGAAVGTGGGAVTDPGQMPDVSGWPPRVLLWALVGALVVAGVVAAYHWVRSNRGRFTGVRQPT